jgi:hypothetical protein
MHGVKLQSKLSSKSISPTTTSRMHWKAWTHQLRRAAPDTAQQPAPRWKWVQSCSQHRVVDNMNTRRHSPSVQAPPQNGGGTWSARRASLEPPCLPISCHRSHLIYGGDGRGANHAPDLRRGREGSRPRHPSLSGWARETWRRRVDWKRERGLIHGIMEGLFAKCLMEEPNHGTLVYFIIRYRLIHIFSSVHPKITNL